MATNTDYTTNQAQTPAQDSPQRAQGRITMSAAGITAADSVAIVVGFRPRYVKWQNITSRICCEWYEGMAANTCMKSAAAGTNTIETTNGGITVDAQGFQVIQNATLLAIAASDVINWTAQG